jgi:hypothetical protein
MFGFRGKYGDNYLVFSILTNHSNIRFKMKKLRFYKKIVVLTMMFGITLILVSCGPTYVRSGYGYNNGYNRPSYGYGYGRPRPYRYYAPPVVVVPRYCPPPRRSYGGGYGRGRRW